MAKSKWSIDPVHSEIIFKVRHMMITNVTGTFDRFTAEMEADENDFAGASISFEADVASVNTRNEQRDAHLRSNDFFEAEQFPKLSFKSSSFKNVGGDSFELIGTINLRGKSKEMNLKVEKTGKVVDPWGQTRIGFEIEGSINRSEFGLLWNAATEDGGVALSEEVKLRVTAQMLKQ
jgi:polyisoprenoid-binding protein YceI